MAEQSAAVGVRFGSGSTYSQKEIANPSRSCGPGGSSRLGATTGAPRSERNVVTAISRFSQAEIGFLTFGMHVATRATTGAGRRCTISERRSLCTTGSSTRSLFSRARDTAASTARRDRSSRPTRSSPLLVIRSRFSVRQRTTFPFRRGRNGSHPPPSAPRRGVSVFRPL